MALDTPTFVSPVPAQENIEAFIYNVSTQGLDSRNDTPETMLGLKLLEFPPFADPRVTKPAVLGTILYSHKLSVTKKYQVPGQAPWYFGTALDGGFEAGWFQKE